MNHHHPNEPEDLIAAAINAAEDIGGPLDGLVEQTATERIGQHDERLLPNRGGL